MIKGNLFTMASVIPDHLPKLQTTGLTFAKSLLRSVNGPANLPLREKSAKPLAMHALQRRDEEINVEEKQWSRHPLWFLHSQPLDSIPLSRFGNSVLVDSDGSTLMDSKVEVAVQPSPPPRRKKVDNSERSDYYVNMGSAIRTLRDELPALFSKELSYDIYRDDITFTDPLNKFHGIENYKLFFWALRFHGKIFFKEIWVDVVRVWQPSDRVILLRWTVKGIPRVPWEAEGRFDGTSKYKLDKDGKIYEHHVDNLAFNFPQKLRTASVLDLVRAAGCPTSPTPTFFGGTGLLVSSYSEEITWLQFYWAVKNTLDFKDVPLGYGCYC